MKLFRVVPILDTVGHMTNYTCIGPVVIVNLILFSISGPSTFLVSKLRFEVFNMICVSFSSFSDSFRKNFWEAEGFHENFKVFRLGSNFRSQLVMAFRVDSLNLQDPSTLKFWENPSVFRKLFENFEIFFDLLYMKKMFSSIGRTRFGRFRRNSSHRKKADILKLGFKFTLVGNGVPVDVGLLH